MDRKYTAWGIMRALLIAQLMLVLFGVVAAFSKEACVIVYAYDMGPAVTSEILTHEYAHCNGWEHPTGFDKKRGYGKAYLPPKQFMGLYSGNVYPIGVTTAQARERCKGDLGCQRLIYE